MFPTKKAITLYAKLNYSYTPSFACSHQSLLHI
jgi:hypothetical protein